MPLSQVSKQPLAEGAPSATYSSPSEGSTLTHTSSSPAPLQSASSISSSLGSSYPTPLPIHGTTRARTSTAAHARHPASQWPLHGAPEVVVTGPKKVMKESHEMFFIFMCFLIGALTRRYLQSFRIPYTALIYCIGFGIGIAALKSRSFSDMAGVDLYKMDPDMLLFLFLPVLLFESAYNIPLHIFSRVFKHCALLAGPGVVASTAIMAGAIKWTGGVSWNWRQALIFGSIMATTDPVAVVAILREIGASEVVSTIVEGESLLNDASAIVVYACLKQDLLGGFLVRWTDFPIAIGKICFLCPLMGWALARLLLCLIQFTFNDKIVEVTITISGAYLCWFLALEALDTSPVLAVVAYGLVMGARKSYVSPEVYHFLHEFWETLGFFANTLIFMLMGVETSMYVVQHLASDHRQLFKDLMLAFWLYIVLNVSRLVIICILRPLFNCTQVKVNLRNTLFMSWAGLRGAVALALALGMGEKDDEYGKPEADPDPKFARQLAFHVSLLVLATNLINGVVTKQVAEFLGICDIPQYRKASVNNAVRLLQRHTHRVIRLLQGDSVMADADWAKVVENTRNQIESPFASPPSQELQQINERARVQALSCFKSEVTHLYESGLASHSTVRRLTRNVNTALFKGQTPEEAALALCSRHVVPGKPNNPSLIWRTFATCPFTRPWTLKKQVFDCYDLGTNFIHAQSHVSEVIDRLYGDPMVADELQRQCHSAMEIVRAYLYPLTFRHPEVTLAIKTRNASRQVLNAYRKVLKDLREDGQLLEIDAQLLEAQINNAMHRLAISHPRTLKFPDPKDVLFTAKCFEKEDEEFMERLAGFELRRTIPNEVIISVGDRAEGLGILVQGICRMEDDDGMVDYVGPGQAFNIWPTLTSNLSTLTLSAQTNALYYWIPTQATQELIKSSRTFETELWRMNGTRSCAHVLKKRLPYAMWSVAKLQDRIDGGEVQHVEAGEQTTLSSHYEYVLLHGIADSPLDEGRIKGPDLIQAPTHPLHERWSMRPRNSLMRGGMVCIATVHFVTSSWLLIIPKYQTEWEADESTANLEIRYHSTSTI